MWKTFFTPFSEESDRAKEAPEAEKSALLWKSSLWNRLKDPVSRGPSDRLSGVFRKPLHRRKSFFRAVSPDAENVLAGLTFSGIRTDRDMRFSTGL